MTTPKPLRVLIVEDEPLLALDVEMMVADAGHTVIGEAASIHDIENMAPELAPDLAFVDMQLAEGSNGLDASALIRRRWRNAIIVFVTGNLRMIPADFAGAHGVIAKPFSRSGFMAAMTYLHEGITDPPPASAKPLDFVATQTLIDSWST